MGGFTRLLHSGEADELMDEIPTHVVQPLQDKDHKGWVSFSWIPVNWWSNSYHNGNVSLHAKGPINHWVLCRASLNIFVGSAEGRAHLWNMAMWKASQNSTLSFKRAMSEFTHRCMCLSEAKHAISSQLSPAWHLLIHLTCAGMLSWIDLGHSISGYVRWRFQRDTSSCRSLITSG